MPCMLLVCILLQILWYIKYFAWLAKISFANQTLTHSRVDRLAVCICYIRDAIRSHIKFTHFSHQRLKPGKLAYHLNFPRSYIHTLLPQLYALLYLSKLLNILTYTSVRALFVYLLPPSGTHCLTVFISVNTWKRSGSTFKPFISNWHSLSPPSDPLPQNIRFSHWFWHYINQCTFLLIYSEARNIRHRCWHSFN